MATKTNTTVNNRDYFRIRRVVGHKNGKSVTKAFYGRSKSEAEDKYDKYKEDQIRKEYEKRIANDLSTFSDRAKDFIDNALKTSVRYAQGTVARYQSAYNTHIKGTRIDKMILTDVTAPDIQGFYNTLDVSQSTLRQVHKFMSVFYKWCVLNGYADNVLSAVMLPVKDDTSRHGDIVVWTEDEIHTITENLGDYRYRFFILLMLYTGMRFSEVLGLKYADIDKTTIHVKRQCYNGQIKEPKANSVRDIPIHPILIDELKRHKAWHTKEMKKNGYRSDFIFTTNTGKHISRSSLDKSIKRFYARIGIEPKHNHAYRSTFCTQLCKCGVTLEVASRLLGHKDISVTARHYALVQPETKQEAINLLHY